MNKFYIITNHQKDEKLEVTRKIQEYMEKSAISSVRQNRVQTQKTIDLQMQQKFRKMWNVYWYLVVTEH